MVRSDIPYYAGYGRQRGSGFGAVALAVGRTLIPIARMGLKSALPLARAGVRKALPIAKKVGKEIIKSMGPELIEVAIEKRKPNKKKLRAAVTSSVKKQIGSGRKKRAIRQKSFAKRSRASFFSNVSP